MVTCFRRKGGMLAHSSAVTAGITFGMNPPPEYAWAKRGEGKLGWFASDSESE